MTMSDLNTPNPTHKNMLDKPLFSGIAVPIAIVLIGALIIFGVTKMLGNSKGHRELVEELQSKTFGNRWVAAFELSKYVAQGKIPETDIPWMIEQLDVTFRESVDARTKNFIVLTFSALKSPLAIPTLEVALDDADDKVRFNAVMAIGNTGNIPAQFDWTKLFKLYDLNDDGLKQVLNYTLATHSVDAAQEYMLKLLYSENHHVRYSAAVALAHFKNEKSIHQLQEIAVLSYDDSQSALFGSAQVEHLKLNVIRAAKKTQWSELLKIIARIAKEDSNLKVSTKAQEVLNILKK
jgi:HEAT repeat protein